MQTWTLLLASCASGFILSEGEARADHCADKATPDEFFACVKGHTGPTPSPQDPIGVPNRESPVIYPPAEIKPDRNLHVPPNFQRPEGFR